MAYQYKNKKGVMYNLHSMVVTLKGTGRKQRIFYFSPKVGKYAIDEMPEAYRVIESKRTGLPILKKK